MENRRNFIRQAIAGLAFVGIFLKDSFVKAMEPKTLEEQNLQKQFGMKSMRLDGSDDYIEVSEDDIKFEGDFTY